MPRTEVPCRWHTAWPDAAPCGVYAHSACQTGEQQRQRWLRRVAQDSRPTPRAIRAQRHSAAPGARQPHAQLLQQRRATQQQEQQHAQAEEQMQQRSSAGAEAAAEMDQPLLCSAPSSSSPAAGRSLFRRRG